jgi:leader peptidase (prepilin peptidase)/N-methyltransferase
LEVQRGVAALIAFVFGGCIGSFVNVVAYRLPRGISIVRPRSFCPSCRRAIPFWANVPILAYLALRGRCNACKAPIPFRYFLTETALAAAAAYLFLTFPPLDAFARFALCAALFAVALIDYDWRVIPNAITFPAIPLGLLAAWLIIPEVGWQSSLIGIAAGAGFLFLTGEVYMWIRGREGVGMGDVWLMGAAGAFLGLPGALFTLFGGSLLGTLGSILFALSGGPPQPLDDEMAPATAGAAPPTDDSRSSFLQMPIPFGPFLALAAAIFALFQPQLVSWYIPG